MSSSTIQEKQEPKSSSSSVFRFLQGVAQVTGGTVLGITMLTSAVVAGGLVGLAASFRNLPDVRVLRNYVPTETTYIYDVKGKPLASLHGEANREVVKLDKISPNLKRAVLAMEDDHFYMHNGINPNSVGRAFLENYREGTVVEGGSTLTMQLVKNLFLKQERKFSRKVAEAVLAIRVEQIFNKDQIFEMYLNQIYWGHNNYGIQTAAQSYFGKPASDLTLGESAMLAGVVQSPEAYSPFVNYEEAKKRQSVALSRMQQLGWITAEEAEATRKQKVKLGKLTSWQKSELPYVTEAVVAELNERFGRDAVVKGGMRVQTTIDYQFQRMAEETVARAHSNLQYRGIYADQVALAAVDPRTHFVKAIVGGIDYRKSQFNRAIQSRRQPGSSFKPFVYYAAFASGKYGPDTTVIDAPISYRDGDGYYSPQNYGGGFSGAMTIRTALAQSTNIPAVKIGKAVGLDKVIEVCRSLGIKSPMEPVTSLPLGAVGVTPLEMAGAFATFASNGWYSEPTVIVRVTDSAGNVLLDNTPKPRQILDPWATASLTNVLQGVISNGTGTAARIGRPAAGKTGTTSSERDIWFVGYVPQLSTAVWVGNDNYRPIGGGATGGVYVAPIWRDFMLQALKKEPVQNFQPASNFPAP
ncbi:MAG: penicillin-binding protein 1A [Cyanobacteriota bacterium]|nr:penicillin-binding protein 1A [Cyanobacteriota bacterium]